MLEGKSTVYKHPKGNTLYVTIPAEIALDSKCFLKPGMVVTVRIRDETILVTEEPKKC